MTDRRLSGAIAEGNGISVLVEVGGYDDVAIAAAHGAEGVVVRDAGALGAVELPVLAHGLTPDDAVAAGAHAVVVGVNQIDDDELTALAEHVMTLGLECVVRVRNEDDLERVLELLDPEVLLLAADDADDDQPPFERVLELLPDVPAGKLVIAELGGASRSEVVELERAGIDAVIVSGPADELVGSAPPDV